MTDLEEYRSPASDLVQWADAAKAAYQLAEGLTKTQFVPDLFRGKPVEAMAAIVAGAEVGLSPMQALQSTYIIGGRPAYYARTMVALTQRQGHEVWTEKETPDSVTVCGRRAGSENVERVTVSIAQARQAGWTRNKQYDTNPMMMLWARAASTVCRRIAADALLGVPYTAEEMQDEQAAQGGHPAGRKVQRQPKTAALTVVPQPPQLEPPAGGEDETGPGPASPSPDDSLPDQPAPTEEGDNRGD